MSYNWILRNQNDWVNSDNTRDPHVALTNQDTINGVITYPKILWYIYDSPDLGLRVVKMSTDLHPHVALTNQDTVDGVLTYPKALWYIYDSLDLGLRVVKMSTDLHPHVTLTRFDAENGVLSYPKALWYIGTYFGDIKALKGQCRKVEELGAFAHTNFTDNTQIVIPQTVLKVGDFSYYFSNATSYKIYDTLVRENTSFPLSFGPYDFTYDFYIVDATIEIIY